MEYPMRRDSTETTSTDVTIVKISRILRWRNTDVASNTDRQSQSLATRTL